MRKLIEWYRSLRTEWTIIAIENKYHAPAIVILSIEVRHFMNDWKYYFTAFFIVYSKNSHFVITIFSLNFLLIKVSDKWVYGIKFFNKVLLSNDTSGVIVPRKPE